MRLEQRVEGVEELLLRHLLAFEEMHVVDEEQIHVVAVAPAELGHRTRVNRFDHVVDELLRPEVLQPGLGVFLEHRMRDGLHQMRLPESRRAVNEERVVRLARRFGDGVCRGRGELVRLADHERLETVPFVERCGPDVRRCRRRRALARRDEEIHLRPPLPVFLHAEDHRRRPAQHALGDAGQEPRVFGFIPFSGELIGRTEDQTTVVECDGLGRLEPRAHRRLGKFTSSFVEEALPSFVYRLLHYDFLILGRTSSKGDRKYGPHVEKSTLTVASRAG